MLSARSRLAVGALRAAARHVLLIAIAVGVLAPAPCAYADDVDAARKKFQEGVRLFQGGDYEGARRLFEEADAEHHAPPIVYNLGLAEERLGHAQAAIDAYERYVAEAGESGELTGPATMAIAQIKARSTKLRVESEPPGARVFVDGAPLAERAPTSLHVARGHHVVVAQGDGWRAEKEIVAEGAGDAADVTLSAPAAEAPSAPPPAPPPAAAPPAREAAPAPRPEAEPRARPDGFVWGAGFAVAPAYMLGVTTAGATNERPATSIAAGPTVDLGVALTDRLEFLFHGFVGIGPDAKPVAYAYTGGPGLSLRLGDVAWIGGSFIGGQFETRAHGERYGTDVVFGARADVSVVVVRQRAGEWIASLSPEALLTRRVADNTTIFFPVVFGYRAY